MKKFVLFVQPDRLRQTRFMEFYSRGFVVQWAGSVAEAQRVVSNIFDWVILDLNSEPNAASSLCSELKQRLIDSKLAFITSPGTEVPPDSQPHAVVPRGISTEALLNLLSAAPGKNPQSVPAVANARLA